MELAWDLIYSECEEFEKVLVTVRDVTELRELQKEAELQKQELEIIGQILFVSSDNFNEFGESSIHFFNANRKLIETALGKDRETIATLFRNIHTVKGNIAICGSNLIILDPTYVGSKVRMINTPSAPSPPCHKELCTK